MVALGKAFAFAVNSSADSHMPPFLQVASPGVSRCFRRPISIGPWHQGVSPLGVSAVCSEEMLGMLLVEVHPFEAYVFRPFR